MRNNVKSAIGLTSYFVSLPPSRYLILAVVLVGFLFGLFIDFGRYGPDNYLLKALIDGSMVLTLPALLSAVIVKLMIKKMPFRRIMATALAGQVVYGTAYLSSYIYSSVNETIAQLIILVGAALVFVLWYVIARLIFILKYRSIIFAIVQLLFYLIFLINSHHLAFISSEPLSDLLTKFSIASFILLAALYLFFLIINAPMKKSFGFSSTDAFTYVISQWLYHNKDLEAAFESVGTRAKTLLSIMGFKRKKDTIYFVTPCVHFGPFGNLGGSEFSYLIANAVDKKYNSKTLVFHGTVTHDLNPVSTNQLDNITAAIDSCIQNAQYKNAKISFSLGKKKECHAECLCINNSAFLGLSRAPKVTEDINLGVGLALMYEAEKFTETAMIVDQHNAETGEITSFEPGDPIGFRYLDAVKNAVSNKKQQTPLSIGVSLRHIENNVLGKAGIKVAVLSSKPEYVIVLVDSNGVTPTFREKIIREIKAMGRNCVVGVYTTDTHQLNMVKGVLNPLKAESHVLEEIKKGVIQARADMQEAQFFSAKKWFELDVIGAKQSIEMVSTVNSVVAVAKLTLPLILVGAILIIVALLSMLY